MHRLNKHTIVLTILYLLLTALLIHTIVFLLLKYFSSLAKLISWGVAFAFIILSLSGIYWCTALFVAGRRHRKPILGIPYRNLEDLTVTTPLTYTTIKPTLSALVT